MNLCKVFIVCNEPGYVQLQSLMLKKTSCTVLAVCILTMINYLLLFLLTAFPSPNDEKKLLMKNRYLSSCVLNYLINLKHLQKKKKLW